MASLAYFISFMKTESLNRESGQMWVFREGTNLNLNQYFITSKSIECKNVQILKVLKGVKNVQFLWNIAVKVNYWLFMLIM